MSNLIDIKNLKYEDVFNDFNLSIKEGSFISISGNNNSGKTALLKLINGLLPSGQAITMGYSYVTEKRVHDHSLEIGSVYGENVNNFLFDDVYKEMAFPLENLNIKPTEIEERILDIAKYFNINELLDKKISDLTTSEKEVLLIAISLLHKPKILLLDEPFKMMDKNTKKKVKEKILEYRKKNKTTIILSTNNLEDTIESDYLYILDKGKIVVEGSPLVVMKEDTLINRLGLSLPFMVDLSLKLQFYGLIDDIELDMEQLVNKLWK